MGVCSSKLPAQTCILRLALCISCMIEVKKCFGKGFGWICALNRWSVQERAQTSFCPVARQVLHYLAWKECRFIAALIMSKLTPFPIVWGVRNGGLGGGGGILGRRPKIWHACLQFIFSPLLKAIFSSDSGLRAVFVNTQGWKGFVCTI